MNVVSNVLVRSGLDCLNLCQEGIKVNLSSTQPRSTNSDVRVQLVRVDKVGIRRELDEVGQFADSDRPDLVLTAQLECRVDRVCPNRVIDANRLIRPVDFT